ncbi:DUF262 domain-containing protein [Luteolibacter sp. Populi]|uniref:GmrSD restriction endonuclease domain-containing protein n=1 Tax=Luteolibacter sp. Populi TaxID=3230487 RepID=UPI003467A3B6
MKDLLDREEEYLIPMYQRNYAWDEPEIRQLIEDIIDYIPKARPYYIGTLVVYERREEGKLVFETVDGQQRLTTLALLGMHLRNARVGDISLYSGPRVRFECREHSRKTLTRIFEGCCENGAMGDLGTGEVNPEILNGYHLIQRILAQKLGNPGELSRFAAYLLDKVLIMRVQVPEGTDLNHYFEIMNNRGEQLEKHEVLKSLMMQAIEEGGGAPADQHCFHRVWETCADMERYVQMGFRPAQRSAIFGYEKWDQFIPADFDELCGMLSVPGDGTAEVPRSLVEIIGDPEPGSSGDDRDGEDPPERFNAVINFPNFLLQVLRVSLSAETAGVTLDDKELLPVFEEQILKAPDKLERVKRFAYDLLRCKNLLDHYILKREFTGESDGWSLKRLKWSGDGDAANRASYVNTFGQEEGKEPVNLRILMLLSAFHVSTPTQIRKYWLNGALHYLSRSEKVDAASYLKHLESMARAFVFDNHLAPVALDYNKIIYANDCHCATRREDVTEESISPLLGYRGIRNNFVFNYLDYLLWRDRNSKDEKSESFRFTPRSSVEHFYAQTPMGKVSPLAPELLDCFGNLCLISHSMNSRLSNFTPKSKSELWQHHVESLKQALMVGAGDWNEAAILRHDGGMKQLLLRSLEEGAG